MRFETHSESAAPSQTPIELRCRSEFELAGRSEKAVSEARLFEQLLIAVEQHKPVVAELAATRFAGEVVRIQESNESDSDTLASHWRCLETKSEMADLFVVFELSVGTGLRTFDIAAWSTDLQFDPEVQLLAARQECKDRWVHGLADLESLGSRVQSKQALEPLVPDDWQAELLELERPVVDMTPADTLAFLERVVSALVGAPVPTDRPAEAQATTWPSVARPCLVELAFL